MPELVVTRLWYLVDSLLGDVAVASGCDYQGSGFAIEAKIESRYVQFILYLSLL